MAICGAIGYPDLFITMTCNPKWPELVRYCKKFGLKPEDRPEIVCRIFKIKLDKLRKDLKSGQVFGKCRAAIYTIEFQKRGLTHAHILLWLPHNRKCTTGKDIDKIISAEIPNKNKEPGYYATIKYLMIHGPCGKQGKKSPCMAKEICGKRFPKDFIKATFIDNEGYPAYRRRNNGRTVDKNGVQLDNRNVVPHNKYLLLKYGAHINIEYCNQGRAVKYFKYVSKGCDMATVRFMKERGNSDVTSDVDEIAMYYDCRYISACETAWRILGFEIQYRDPPVERLSFHLPEKQIVVFKEDDTLEEVVDREIVRENKFLAWMTANDIYEEARELTYAQFPSKFA